MSSNGSSNLYITRTVRCTWTLKDGSHKYDFLSFAKTDEKALEEAYENVIWAKHETFKAEIYKREVHW